MGLEKTRFEGTYASVLASGEISVKCKEGDEGAVRREYEDSKDKTMKVKFEKIYDQVSGYITGLKFFDGDFGKVLQTSFKDGETEIILCFAVSSNFCEDFMKKLPNVDFSHKVVIKPYSFEDDKKKLRKGVTILQENVKVPNYFSQEVDGKFVPANGFPEVEIGKTYDKDDWKVYFINVRKFLVSFTEDAVAPKIVNAKPMEAADIIKEVGGEIVDGDKSIDEIDVQAMPFNE